RGKRRGAGKGIRACVKIVIAEEIEQGAVELIGSAEGGHVYLNLQMPEFGRVNAGLHLEFLQGINRGKQGVGVEAGIVILDAVQRKVQVLAARAGDKDFLGGSIAALARASLASVGDAIVGDVGAKSDK